MLRKIIRPGDWSDLARKAKDALYPDPPEPTRSKPAATVPVQSQSTSTKQDERYFTAMAPITSKLSAEYLELEFAAVRENPLPNETAKLLRQWNKSFFEIPTVEVVAQLLLNKELAREVIRWARSNHYAWTVKHGRSLVELEAIHEMIRSAKYESAIEDLESTDLKDRVTRCDLCSNYPTRTRVGIYAGIGKGLLSKLRDVAVLRCSECNAVESFYVKQGSR